MSCCLVVVLVLIVLLSSTKARVNEMGESAVGSWVAGDKARLVASELVGSSISGSKKKREKLNSD